tara:strand:+ start:8166 stop:9029 length:864 start_codon:yes stop_codon:yes gene_type:complete
VIYVYPNYFYKKKVLKLINQILNLKSNYYLNKELHKKKNQINDDKFFINKEDGYKFIDNKNSLPSHLMNSLESFCNLERIKRFKKKSNNKDFMINLLEDGDIQKIDGLIEFALSDNIINLATKYLNTIPFLAYIYIFHSLPNDTVQSSQLFHCDTEDDSQLKFFFYLNDVNDNNGPFVFIPRKKSLEIMKKTNYQGKRLQDSEICKHIEKKEMIRFIGKKGSGLAIDTCGCLHYGSRENKSPRKLLMFQFTNHFTSLYYKSNLAKYINFSKIEKEKLIYCIPQKNFF